MTNGQPFRGRGALGAAALLLWVWIAARALALLTLGRSTAAHALANAGAADAWPERFTGTSGELWLARLVAPSLHEVPAWSLSWGVSLLWADVVAVLALLLTAHKLERAGPFPAHVGTRAVVGWVLVTAALGFVPWREPTLFAAALSALSVAAALHGRARLFAAPLLAAAAWIEPACLFAAPALIAYESGATADRRAPRALASGLRFALSFAALLAASVAAYGGGALAGLRTALAPSVVELHTWAAGVALALAHLGGRAPTVSAGLPPIVVTTSAAPALAALATALAAVAAGLAAAAGAAAVAPRRGGARDRALLLAAAAPVLAFASLAPQASPALLLVGAAPVVVLAGATSGRRTQRAFELVLLAALVTSWIGPDAYAYFQDLGLVEAGLLIAKGALLFLAALLLVRRRATSWVWPRLEPRVATWLGRASFALLALFILAWNLAPITDDDLWIHLRVGEEILRTGQLPRQDLWSATAAGEPYLPHSWLFDVVEIALFRVSAASLSWLQALLVAATVLLVALHVPRPARTGAVAAPVLATLAHLLASRSMFRAYLVTVLLLALVTLALDRWRATGRAWPLALLVPVTALWANVHGSFLLPSVVLVIVAASTVLDRVWPLGGEARGRALAPPLACALACALAALATPFGTELYAFTFDVFGADYIRDNILEWQGLFYVHWRAHGSWFLLVAFLLAVPTALVLARDLLWRDVAFAALGIVLVLRSERFAAYSLVLVAPVLWRAAHDALLRAAPALARRRIVLELAGAVALVAFTFGPGLTYVSDRPEDVAAGVATKPFYEGVAYLKANGAEGVVYSEYIYGGYLLWAGVPELRPVIDGRIEVFGEERALAYFRSAQPSGNHLFDYLDEHRVDYVLLVERARRHGVLLDAHEGWRRIAGPPTTSGWFLWARAESAVPRPSISP